MSIEAIVKEFSAVAANPKGQLKAYKDAGKKCIGVMPYYAPEELVYAAGMMPFGMWGSNSKTIQRAKEYITAHYGDEGLSLHTVAAAVGFSPNHFSTVFSQQTGETFVEYLTRVRIDAAKDMLRAGGAKMSDIAFDVGYHDPNYFSYIFKKHTGASPREYRAGCQ